MEINEIIKNLEFTKEMMMFNPSTGEMCHPEDLNEMDKITYDGCECAIKVLEKVDKYRWHDLRKYPDDLPNDRQRILFKTVDFYDEEEFRYWTGIFYGYPSADKNIFCNDDYEGYVTHSDYDASEIIAWREIEPFEEEVE